MPIRTHLTYNNDKLWFTTKLKVLYKQAKYTMEKEIRVGKRNYSDKLRIQFSSSYSASVWKCMKDNHQLQDTIPQHFGESTPGRQSE